MNILASIGLLIFFFELTKDIFIKLDYPTLLIYPMLIANVIALSAIVTNISKWLKEGAYVILVDI